MDGWITIGTELDTKKFDAQILQLERKANDLEKQLEDPKSLGFSDEDILQIEVELEKTKNKLVSLRKEKQKLEETKGTQGITEGINNLGNSFQNAVSKAGRLALAIFGIRTAYNLLKSASSELATYDEQYATNLEYIRFVLAQAIAPVLRGIVQLAMQLLSYINAIVQAWFGINLFSNGSAENFKKMKAQAGGVSKAVKEIKKQLAGFDEVNILTDQSDTGTSAGAGGVGMPTMDLSAMQGEPPAWLKWIIDNKDVILAVLGGIAAGLLALKLGLGGIKALGIGIMVTGIITAVQGLIGYLNDPSWENFGKVIQGIGIFLVGLAITIGSVSLGIIGAVVIVVGTIIKYWEQIKGFFQRGIDWLKGKGDWVEKNLGGWVKGLYDTFVGFLQLILNYFDGTFNAIKRIFDGIIQFFQGVFTGDWGKAWEGIQNIVGGVVDWMKNNFYTFLNWIDTVILTPLSNFFHTLWEGVKTGAQNAWNGMKSIWEKVTSFFKTIFTNAWNAVKQVFSTGGKIFDGIKEGIVSAFKNIVNGIITGINKVVSVPFNAINGMLRTLRNVSIAGYQPFSFIHEFSVPQIPKLATGGIINMPNRGTLVGASAIGGEAGREGVIPLTDAQAMAELGEAIGKHVTINASIINKMNTRTISRELVRAQNEQNFAYNG
jgi:phage-related protein